MVEISRTVRFCLTDRPPAAGAAEPARHNTFSAWPPLRGLDRFYQLEVTCAGRPDEQTGYLVNISHIDSAVRRLALPLFQAALAHGGAEEVPLGHLLRAIASALGPELGPDFRRLKLLLTPFFSLTLQSHDMDQLTIRQQFEFAAAHRLHVPDFSAAENLRTFGKCNNPAGHGHNYRLEVAVRGPIDATGRVVSAETIDATVDRAVIQPLDHKHLNLDVPHFAHLNPSVENITRTIYDWLQPPFAAQGLTLEEVRVWETEKTVCTYRGPQDGPR